VQVSNASGRVSGLSNNTLYYFAITAVKDGVEGSQSAMVTASSPIGSPSLDNLSDKYFILNSDITAFAFNNTNSAASSCSSELLVKPETLPLALDTCTEGVLPKLDALISFWE
jgi:hypothetical protein